MRIEVGLLVVIAVLLVALWSVGRRRPFPRPAPRPMLPPNLKIIWNPYTTAWTWAQQNPQTHFWDWRREATTEEITRWMCDTGNEPPNHLVFFKPEGVSSKEFTL